MDTWAPARGETDLGSLIAGVRPWLDQACGITLTGGEPFDQPEALDAVLRAVRAEFSGDVLVYTGYPIEAIAPRIERLAGLIDALISDPYDPDAGDLLPLRGSDNQRLHRLTAMGRERFADYDIPGHKDRALDLMVDAQGDFWFAGIPRRGDFAALRALLEGQGHRALTSEHRERSLR